MIIILQEQDRCLGLDQVHHFKGKMAQWLVDSGGYRRVDSLQMESLMKPASGGGSVALPLNCQ